LCTTWPSRVKIRSPIGILNSRKVPILKAWEDKTLPKKNYRSNSKICKTCPIQAACASAGSGEIKIKISAPNIEINNMLITNKNILEHHNLKNLAGVTLFCSKLFPECEKEFYKAASTYFQPEMNRSQWIQNIFLDAYNANPSSMKTSLNSFVESMRTKNINLDDCYFILGDMNELGEFAPEFHKEIALHVASLGIKNISFLGRYREHYLTGYARPTSHYLTKEEFYPEWKKIRNDFKYIFIKASRSMQLETLSSVM
jgi:UDP-N-acetylmuramoyl-tripeptide--D-alanyl-D-alanine ligase